MLRDMYKDDSRDAVTVRFIHDCSLGFRMCGII